MMKLYIFMDMISQEQYVIFKLSMTLGHAYKQCECDEA